MSYRFNDDGKYVPDSCDLWQYNRIPRGIRRSKSINIAGRPMYSESMNSDMVCGSSVLSTLATVVEELIRPTANVADQVGVPRAHLAALAETGVFRLAGSRHYAENADAAVTLREASEMLAGACGATRFVYAQHLLPLRVLTQSDNEKAKEQWLPKFMAGQAITGNAVGHVLRPGPPGLLARRRDGAWHLTGSLPWYTGWGLNDMALIAVQTSTGLIMQVLVPAVHRGGVSASPDLPLTVMQGTHTVSLTFADVPVTDDEIIHMSAKADYVTRYLERTANASPAVFGLLRSVIDAIAERAGRVQVAEAGKFAAESAATAARIREEAYQLIDQVPADEQMDRRLTLRAQAALLLVRCAHAYLVLCGGGGLAVEHEAQRWLREAMFYLVQAQTQENRRAFLAALGLGRKEPGTHCRSASRFSAPLSAIARVT